MYSSLRILYVHLMHTLKVTDSHKQFRQELKTYYFNNVCS